MWNDFVNTFGWRFHGVEGYQGAQLWVEELKEWVSKHEASLITLWFVSGVSIFINIVLMAVAAFTIGGR
jgi:methionine synthase II (cobalamin-independent)